MLKFFKKFFVLNVHLDIIKAIIYIVIYNKPFLFSHNHFLNIFFAIFSLKKQQQIITL